MDGSGDVTGPSGILLVDKPAGITSHDAVAAVRRALGTRKVGHAGTLDPMATGLLVVGVGRATRLLRFLGEFPKLYEGTGVLGMETETLDAEGAVVRRASVDVDERALREAMDRLTGDLEQRPPAFSAVKVGGRKLYRAARAGRDVPEALPRRIHVFAFNLRRFDGQRFEFRVEAASSPDRPGELLPVDAAVAHLAAVTLHPEEARVAVHGRCLGPAGITGPYRAVAPDGRLIGIYRDDGAKAVPEVILAPA